MINSLVFGALKTTLGILPLFGFFFLFSGAIVAQEQSEIHSMKVKISFGQKGPLQTEKKIIMKSSIPGFSISDLEGSLSKLLDREEIILD